MHPSTTGTVDVKTEYALFSALEFVEAYIEAY
jgi:hypothetical protein